jgi:hypothetical protein
MSLSPIEPGTGHLGSLVQSSREKKLRDARNALIFASILVLLIYTLIIVVSPMWLDDRVKEEMQRGRWVDPESVETAKRIIYIIGGAGIALGVVFAGLAALLYRKPVAVTVTGLVLFVANMAFLAALNIQFLISLWMIGFLIVLILLIRSLRVAIAYQKDQPVTALLDPDHEQ